MKHLSSLPFFGFIFAMLDFCLTAKPNSQGVFCGALFGGGGGGSSSQASTTNNSDNRVVGQGEAVGVSGSSNVTINQNRTTTDYGAIEGAAGIVNKALDANTTTTKAAFGFASATSKDALALVDHTASMFQKGVNDSSKNAIDQVAAAYSEAKGNGIQSQKNTMLIAGVAVVGVAAVAIAMRK
jgi:hypothetical protein